MKNTFKIGDKKVYRHTVTANDFAIFQGKLIHRVCSTFALGREVEWSSRLFFLEMMEADEEGVGTFLQIEHKSPAFEGEEMIFNAEVEKIEGMELTCHIEVKVANRLIAVCKTGQRMMRKEKLAAIFTKPSI